MFFLSDDPLFSDEELLLMCAASGGKTVEDTATGNPLTFVTDIAKPLKSLLIPFTPKQEGTGDPSPSNIRSILPWNGLTVFGGGKNLLYSEFVQGSISGTTGEDVPLGTRVRTGFMYVKGGQTLWLNATGTDQGIIYIYNTDRTFRTDIGNYSFRTLPISQSFENDQLIRICLRKNDNSSITPSDVSNAMLNSGDSAISYAPPSITDTDIVFPSPVYGGTLDVVSGVLSVEWAGFSATWGDGESATDMGEGITRKVYPMVDYLTTGLANNMCNIAPYSANENANVHFYYSGSGATNRKCRLFLPSDTPDTTVVTVVTKLSQTYEVQLTGEQITALVGDNTIWSDADGNMTAVYIKKG